MVDSYEKELDKVKFLEEVLPVAALHMILTGNSLFLSSVASHEHDQTMSHIALQEK